MSASALSKRVSPPVIVLGAHRSGTSYLASVVGAWGVKLGDNQLPPTPSNPRGYFEDRDFVTFHGNVLSRVLPPPIVPQKYGPIYVHGNLLIGLTEEDRSAAFILTRNRQREHPWGWKDPRTCLFLDFWLDHFPDATLVAIFRHPLEVFGSEVRRKSLDLFFDPALSVDTWLEYNRRIVAAWKSHRGPRILLCADAAFRRPELLFRAVESALGKNRHSPPEFSSPEFRAWRIAADVQSAFDRLFSEAAEVWRELNALATIPAEKSERHAPETEDGNPLLARVDAMRPSSRGLDLLTLAAFADAQFRTDWDSLASVARAHTVAAFHRAEDFERRAVQEKNRVTVLRNLVSQMEIHARELTEWRAKSLSAAMATATSARSVFLWGANRLAELVNYNLEERGIRIAGIVDRQGGAALTPEQFFDLNSNVATPAFVVVCSASARDEIVMTLEANGWQEGRDYVALPPHISQ